MSIKAALQKTVKRETGVPEVTLLVTALTRHVERRVVGGTSAVSGSYPQSFEMMKFVSFQGF
jgi:hypothetical protein